MAGLVKLARMACFWGGPAAGRDGFEGLIASARSALEGAPGTAGDPAIVGPTSGTAGRLPGATMNEGSRRG